MKKFFPFFIIPSVLILDRFSKIFIMRHFSEGRGLAMWPFFYLTRVNNTGAAFGMLKGNSSALALVSIVCIIGVAVVLARDFRHETHYLRNTALSLIAAGAAGNLYDRLHYGYVVDFLDFRVWPVFNLADSVICVGIFMLILGLFMTAKNG